MANTSDQTSPPSETSLLLPKPPISQPQQPPSDVPQSTLTTSQGYGLMFGAALFEALQDFFLHFSEQTFRYPPSTSLLMSSIVYLIISSAYLYRNDLFRAFKLPTPQLLRIAARAFSAGFSLYLGNIALQIVPVGTVMTLFATVPIITSVLAAIFLKESFSARDFITLFVNIVGVSLIAVSAGDEAVEAANGKTVVYGIFVTLASAVIASGGFVILKGMGTSVHFMQHVFSIGLCMFFISLVVVDKHDFTQVWLNHKGTGLAVLIGVIGFLLKTCVNKAMQVIRPGPALLIRGLSVPMGFALGLIFMNEHLTLVPAIGAGLVLSSVTYTSIEQIAGMGSRVRVKPVGKGVGEEGEKGKVGVGNV